VSPPLDNKDRGKKWNEQILDAIDSKTRVVAIANVHWADGTRFDLEGIRVRTREVGALLIVDGTQSVGAMPFDIQAIQPDALICAGYKWLLGPYSIGLAYYGPAFDNGKPLEENWINRLNSEDFAGLVQYEKRYQDGALRYEVGEHSNFILVPMLMKAIQTIRKWGVDQIQEYCQHISTDAIKSLREKGFFIEDEAWRGSHLFGMRLPDGMELSKLKDSFLRHRVFVSFRGNAVRVAPNVYNTTADFDRMLKAIKKM
jgi:selenocysteine lyase/cysteine desulfurase